MEFEVDRCYIGDCRDSMRDMIARGVKVHTCVTSPPYWGLRDYGCPPSIWGGLDICAHEWGDNVRIHKGGPHGDSVHLGGRAVLEAQTACKNIDAGKFCRKCGAWCGQLGLEPTYTMYIEHMVEVFRLVRDLLIDEGTTWINVGDSYATGAGKVGDCPGGGEQGKNWLGVNGRGHRGQHLANQSGKAKYRGEAMGPVTQPNRMPQPGLKPKDLCMIPFRLALALQADGWWVRNDIIWHKPNPMPESVTDRCTKAHEYIFLLSKSEKYYFDAEAISEPAASAEEIMWDNGKNGHAGGQSHAGQGSSTRKFKVPANWDTGPGHHKSFHRNGREEETTYRSGRSGNKNRKQRPDAPASHTGQQSGSVPWEGVRRNKRDVWTVPTQPYPDAHFATFPPALIEPCVVAGAPPGGIVFDPFFGSGTTGEVAQRLGRRWIGCEINHSYMNMQRQRCSQTGMML